MKIDKLKRSEKMKTVIYATTGSVACIKSKEIVQKLMAKSYNVVLIRSTNSKHFTGGRDGEEDKWNGDKEWIINENEINEG